MAILTETAENIAEAMAQWSYHERDNKRNAGLLQKLGGKLEEEAKLYRMIAPKGTILESRNVPLGKKGIFINHEAFCGFMSSFQVFPGIGVGHTALLHMKLLESNRLAEIANVQAKDILIIGLYPRMYTPPIVAVNPFLHLPSTAYLFDEDGNAGKFSIHGIKSFDEATDTYKAVERMFDESIIQNSDYPLVSIASDILQEEI